MPKETQPPNQNAEQDAADRRKFETAKQPAADLEGETTRDLLGEEREKLAEIQKFQLTDLSVVPQDGLAIVIRGEDEPIIVEKVQRIVLGRDVRASDFSRVIDLAEHDAMEKGVSRKHAMLASVSGIYYLNDMASTNGTWLNGNRLAAFRSHELKPGDWVKLGNLEMRIYFKPAQEILTINLIPKQETAGEPPILTPRYLAEEVAPFMVAVETIQKITDYIKGAPTTEIVLRHISGPPLTLSIVHGALAIKLIRGHFEPWAAANEELINKGIKKQEKDVALQEAQTKLAREMLKVVKSDIPKDVEEASIKKLVACINSLMSSSLKLSEEKLKPIR